MYKTFFSWMISFNILSFMLFIRLNGHYMAWLLPPWSFFPLGAHGKCTGNEWMWFVYTKREIIVHMIPFCIQALDSFLFQLNEIIREYYYDEKALFRSICFYLFRQLSSIPTKSFQFGSRYSGQGMATKRRFVPFIWRCFKIYCKLVFFFMCLRQTHTHTKYERQRK